MTSIELVESMDWAWTVGADGTKAPWLTAAVAMFVGVTHLAAGFAYRRPYLVAKARKVLIAAQDAGRRGPSNGRVGDPSRGGECGDRQPAR